jgi:quinol monooxygenase YgiN
MAKKEGSNELFIFARFHARIGQQHIVADLLREETIAAKADPGCLSHQVYRSTRDPQLFFIHSRWSDEEAFETHLKLVHTSRFAERVEPLLDHGLEVARTRPILGI